MSIDVKIVPSKPTDINPEKYNHTIKGEDGISAEHEWNGTVLTITSASGTSSADLKGDQGPQGIPGKDGADGKDGLNGKDGQNGKDGYTPVKGIDYFDGANGKDGTNGKDGANGKDGYTPVKGVDYFDGAPGPQGTQGIQGPVGPKGDDYSITDADYEAIANKTKDKIDLTDYDKVFFAEYNKTTAEEIAQALAEHKDIRVEYASNVYQYILFSSGVYYFSAYAGLFVSRYLALNATTNKWATSAVNLQAKITDIDDIRSGASAGATAVQPSALDEYAKTEDVPTKVSELENDEGFIKDYTETDPTVPSWAKESESPIKYFAITEDMVTVTTDDTKGVAPYSSTYGYTNIEISKDAGIRWVEGGLYSFIVNTKMVVGNSYRNVRIRIGGDTDGDVWHPLFTTSSIAAGNTYLVKAYNTLWQYKTVYRSEGALHLQTDSNTTYAYLVNTILGDATDAPLSIDAKGYGARYSLIFPTKPLSESLAGEVYSSIVASSSTGTTKKAVTVPKLYLDRKPLYVYSANVAAGAKPVNSLYQNYSAMDLRYTVNTSATYMTRTRRVFMYLHNFNPNDMSFVPDATVGNIMTIDKIATRFPATVKGDVYLYLLGWTQANWYALSPVFANEIQLYKYTPSTGVLKPYVPTYYY